MNTPTLTTVFPLQEEQPDRERQLSLLLFFEWPLVAVFFRAHHQGCIILCSPAAAAVVIVMVNSFTLFLFFFAAFLLK